MHEYPVTVQIVDIASETARKNNGRVHRIDLVVGEDSGFIGESIQMYFDVIAEGTLCEGAQLFIEGVKPQLRCEKCGKHFERKRFSFQCPYCGCAVKNAGNILNGNGFPFNVLIAAGMGNLRPSAKSST